MNEVEKIELRWPEWFQPEDEDRVKELENLAGIGYSPQKIAQYFKINEDMFMSEFMMPGSGLRYHYDRGVLVYEANDSIEMMKGAASGNATQGQRWDKRKAEQKFEELKEKHIYGEE